MRFRDPEAWAKHLSQSSCRIAHETPTGHSRIAGHGLPAGHRVQVGRKVDRLTGLPLLIWQLEAAGAPTPVREYRFHTERKWRADLAWPPQLVIVEYEGGVYTQGDHVRGPGFEKDCYKYNAAALLGFRILRFTDRLVNEGSALASCLQILGVSSETPATAGANIVGDD